MLLGTKAQRHQDTKFFDRITKKKSEIRRQNSERRGTFVHGDLLWPKCTIRPAKKDFLLDIDLQEFTKILSSTCSLVIVHCSLLIFNTARHFCPQLCVLYQIFEGNSRKNLTANER